MNGCERMKAAMRGEPADYRPVMLHNFMCSVKEAGINFDEFRQDPKKAAEVFIRSTEKYDLDAVLIDFDTATLAEACGCTVVDAPDKASVVVKGVLDDITDVSRLKPVALENSRRVQTWLETSRILKEYFGKEKYIRCNCDQAPFSLASMLRNSQELMMDLADEDNEEDICALLDYCLDVSSQFIRLAAQTGADAVSNGDSVAGPAMISPAMYQKFGMPYEKPLAELAHTYHMDYLLHICGDTTKILEFMPTLGVDAMELDYKTDMQKMHDVLAGCTTVSGILDPSSVFLQGSPETVRKETMKLLDVYRDSRRLIACSGCALGPETPEENMKEFIAAVRSHG